MSDQNNNGASRPSSRNRPSNSVPRIGRIGQWGDSSGTASNSRSGSGARIGTLRDLNTSSGRGAPSGHNSDSDDDDKDSSEDGETWFTGGERSGLSVQNPNHRQNNPGGDLVRSVLKKAAEAGVPATATAGSTSRVAFSGSGNTLGSDETESRFVPDPNAPPEQSSEEPRVLRHITFWRDGFNIEDGPLMGYDDPGNAEILRAIDQGQAPPHLMNVHYGQPVELRVVRRMDESYTPPPSRPHQAFEGAGHRLGAPTPAFAGEGSGSAGPIASGRDSASAPVVRNEEPQSVQTKFEVDQTQPTTSIPLRLADGTRILCRMNLTHTIRDIRNFINASRPENLTRPYIISTMYPNRILDDDSQTIEAAGLQNSVVVQRWA